MEMDDRGVERLNCLNRVEELEMRMNKQLDELVLLFLCCYMGFEEFAKGNGSGLFVFCFDEFIRRIGRLFGSFFAICYCVCLEGGGFYERLEI